MRKPKTYTRILYTLYTCAVRKYSLFWSYEMDGNEIEFD